MTRTLLPAALAATLATAVLAAAAVPAFAVSIRHTNRAEGEPDAGAGARAASRAAPPTDTSGPHYFDKAHEDRARD